MVPAAFVPLRHFPLTANGKVDRSSLRSMDSRTIVAESQKIADHGTNLPQDPRLQEIEKTVCQWLSELLDIPAVAGHSDFFEIGGQSLIAAQVAQRISRKYRVHIKPSIFIKARTARAIAEFIFAAEDNKPIQVSPLVTLRSEGSKLPLFFIAGVGGSVVNFELLARTLGDDRPVYAIETHGFNKNSQKLDTIEDMARGYLEEFRQVQPKGPYYLVGYSFGGVIAFEMAHQLRAMGEQIGLLGMIDTPEWHYMQQVEAALSLSSKLNIRYGGFVKRILCGPDRMKAAKARVRGLITGVRDSYMAWSARVPHESGDQTRQRNLEALGRYKPKVYEGEVHLYRCPDPSPLRGSDPALGWGHWAPRLSVSEIPGEHGTLTTLPYVGFLGEALKKSLEATDADEDRHNRSWNLFPSGFALR
jgi:thioesterase domain-containing protein